MRWIIPIILLLAPPAWGISQWSTEPGATNENCVNQAMTPKTFRRCYSDFTDSDTVSTNSKMVNVTGCENTTVCFYPDVTGTGTTGRVKVYSCGANTVSQTQGCFVVENVTLDGVSSTNTECIYGFDADWIFYEIDVASAAGEEPRVVVRCNQ